MGRGFVVHSLGLSDGKQRRGSEHGCDRAWWSWGGWVVVLGEPVAPCVNVLDFL